MNYCQQCVHGKKYYGDWDCILNLPGFRPTGQPGGSCLLFVPKEKERIDAASEETVVPSAGP